MRPALVRAISTAAALAVGQAVAAPASSGTCAAGDVGGAIGGGALLQTQRTERKQDPAAASPGLPEIQGLLALAASTQERASWADSAQVDAWKAYRPCSSCRQPVRVGEGHDGGYLMCGELLQGTRAAYSYGIHGFDGWGAQLSDRLGIRVEQYDCYDHTRPSCPQGLHCDFAFHEECVGSQALSKGGRSFRTLADHLADHGHALANGSTADLVMKMDIEGSEWAILADDSMLPLLRRFSQIVVEFHGAVDVTSVKQKALKNLVQLFTVVHVHGNNCCRSQRTRDGFEIPRILEVTFVRRGLVPEGDCQASPPLSPLDHRNVKKHPELPDMKLPEGV